MLHLLRRLGVAAPRSNALQGSHGEPRAQVLSCPGQGQQGLQRSLVAAVIAALAAFLTDLDVGLGAGTMVVEIGISPDFSPVVNSHE